jgi:hypothetical protein
MPALGAIADDLAASGGATRSPSTPYPRIRGTNLNGIERDLNARNTCNQLNHNCLPAVNREHLNVSALIKT